MQIKMRGKGKHTKGAVVIKIRSDSKEKLDSLMIVENESYSSVVQRLIDFYEENKTKEDEEEEEPKETEDDEPDEDYQEETLKKDIPFISVSKPVVPISIKEEIKKKWIEI